MPKLSLPLLWPAHEVTKRRHFPSFYQEKKKERDM
jgi:hypothetical protein